MEKLDIRQYGVIQVVRTLNFEGHQSSIRRVLCLPTIIIIPGCTLRPEAPKIEPNVAVLRVNNTH